MSPELRTHIENRVDTMAALAVLFGTLANEALDRDDLEMAKPLARDAETYLYAAQCYNAFLGGGKIQ